MTPDELLLLAEVCLDTLIASNNTDNHEVSTNAVENVDDATTIELAVVTLHRIFTIWSQTPRLVENSTSVTRDNDRMASAATTATSTTSDTVACDTNLASARTTRSFNSARELIQELRQSWILVGYTVVLATKTSSANVSTNTGNTQQQRQQALQVSSSRQGGSLAATGLNLSTCAALHLGMGAQTQDRLFDYLRTQLRSLGSRGSRSSSGNGHSNTSTMIVSLPHRSSSWSCISEIQVALQVDLPTQYTPSPHPLNPPSDHTVITHPIIPLHHTLSIYSYRNNNNSNLLRSLVKKC